MRVAVLGAVAATMLAGAAIPVTAAEAKPDRKDWQAAKPDGKPEDCVSIARIRETRVRSDGVIDFYMNGGKVYRNILPNSCPSLGFEKRFSYATSQSQLCSVDIITVLTTAGPGLQRGASCGLGTFQPVAGAPR